VMLHGWRESSPIAEYRSVAEHENVTSIPASAAGKLNNITFLILASMNSMALKSSGSGRL
jgi:hypothetical protein